MNQPDRFRTARVVCLTCAHIYRHPTGTDLPDANFLGDSLKKDHEVMVFDTTPKFKPFSSESYPAGGM